MEVDYLQKEGDQEGTPVQQGVDLGDTLVQEGVDWDTPDLEGLGQEEVGLEGTSKK